MDIGNSLIFPINNNFGITLDISKKTNKFTFCFFLLTFFSCGAAQNQGNLCSLIVKMEVLLALSIAPAALAAKKKLKLRKKSCEENS